MNFTLVSPEFNPNARIPSPYTCDGSDKSPELNWANAPENTKSFALIVDDPDAPGGTWVHWVLFNISGKATTLPTATDTPNGAVSGLNTWGNTGYGGPCPPSGTHRYFFKLYALDKMLDLDASADKQAVEMAMKGHVLAESTLMGVYSRERD